MARKKTFPVALTDEQRVRFQKAADKEGESLAQFIRHAAEMRATGRFRDPHTGEEAEVVPLQVIGEGKRTYESDPKVKRPRT